MKSIFFILFLLLIVYSSPNIGRDIADCAYQQLGKPYKTGGIGPDSFDDFGLVYYCMKQLNLFCYIDRKYQAIQGKKIKDLAPGDVLYTYDKNRNLIGAIIYYGDSKVIYTTGYLNRGVILSTLSNLNMDNYYDYRRNWES